jgi:hypothetical protein
MMHQRFGVGSPLAITNGAEPLMETSERTTVTCVFFTATAAGVELPTIIKQSLNFVSSVPLQDRARLPTTATET